MAIGLAFRAFFAVLSGKEAASAVKAALDGLGSKPAEAAIEKAPAPAAVKAKEMTAEAKPAPALAASGRSDALTLLSTLQREARLLDLVYEPLDGFEDAQVGAAARQVLSETHKALDRMFGMEPLTETVEGDRVEIPKPTSPIRYKIVGRGSDAATRGTVAHRGWKASRCQVPTWNGSRDDANVLAPIEVEVDG